MFHEPGGVVVMRNVRQSCLLLLTLFAMAGGSVRADDSGLFAVAAGHYRNGRWEQACEAFARLFESDPQAAGRSEMQFFYGEALVQLGRWNDARPHFARVLELDASGPHSQQCLFRVGEAAYMVGDDAEAQRQLTAFADRYPDDPLNAYGLAYLGGLALQAEQANVAQKWFEASLERYPHGPMAAESQFGLAQVYHMRGEPKEALTAYRHVVEQGGELTEPALLQVGAIENVLGEHPAALATFDDFIRQFPQSELIDKAHLGRGYAMLKLGRTQEAQQVFTALAASPATQLEASYYLALTQAAQGQWRVASETLSQTKLDPQHVLAPAVNFHSADALLHSGNFEAVREAFDRVLQRYPDSAWADDSLLGKLRIAVENKDAAESLELAEDLLKRFPDSPLVDQARLAKGQALALLDKPADAVVQLRSLLDADPATIPDADQLRARAQGILAICQAKLGNFDDARKTLATLAQSSPAREVIDEAKLRVGELAQLAGQQPLAQDLLAGVVEGSAKIASRAQSSLAWNYFNAGRWTEAADAFQQVLDAAPGDPLAAEAALMRGRALEHLDHPDEAMAMYELVVNRYSDTPRAAEAMLCAARLHEQLGRLDEARRGYATLIETHPEFVGLDEAIYRSACLRLTSNPAAANELFNRLRTEFAASPYVSDATLRLAEAAIAKSDFETAKTLLREVTRPDAPLEIRPQALYLEGRTELASGHWTAAQRPLTQLLKEHADSDLALPAEYLLGEASFRQGDFEQAASRLDALAKKTAELNDTWLPTAELRRAQALAQLRRWNEALAVAEKIAARFPNFPEQYEVNYLLGRAYAAQADFDSARQWYKKTLEAPEAVGSETAAMARWMLGESYFHQEKYPQALAEYLQVDGHFPHWHAAALLQSGKAEQAQGQWKRAADFYQKLLELYPDSELNAEANRRLVAMRQRLASGPTARK